MEQSSPPIEGDDNSPPPTNPLLPSPSSVGISNCYVFKSRLQEYAQKASILTPVYETLKDGPSHEPVFKSKVTVDGVCYESLPGFLNRKAAEQSAAEVALMELQKAGKMTVPLPTVHETGLCKNLLQEYAQKKNYAIPSYKCEKQSSGANLFTCTVDIGGIQYIGAAGRTKKDAEIKAARTALLAIQHGPGTGANGGYQYAVLPGKRKAKEQETQSKPVKELKAKKAKFNKKWSNKKFLENKIGIGTILDHDKPLIEAIDGGEKLIARGNDVEMSAMKDDHVIQISGIGIGTILDHDKPLIEAIEGGGKLIARGNDVEMPAVKDEDGLMTAKAERSEESCEKKFTDIIMLQEVVNVVPLELSGDTGGN